MSDLKHYGPAFPQAYEHNQVVNEMLANSRLTPEQHVTAVRQLAGLNRRQYAAIHLKVPNSGTDWLDEMIETSLRNDLAAKAMQSLCTKHYAPRSGMAAWAYAMADSMRKAAK